MARIAVGLVRGDQFGGVLIVGTAIPPGSVGL